MGLAATRFAVTGLYEITASLAWKTTAAGAAGQQHDRTVAEVHVLTVEPGRSCVGGRAG
jgi:hypothetical protein